MTNKGFEISGRKIGIDQPPFVIAEIGINHTGSVEKARRMIDDAAAAGAECVKFQCHILDDEMSPAARQVIPGNATKSIWDVMEEAVFSEEQERELQAYTLSKGLIYLSTPFSRAAANRLQGMNVPAYKIGSGECNNYPLIKHIASFGKPVILSTGMNNLESIRPSVKILTEAGVPFALLHCVSMYPTPYDKVYLGALRSLTEAFPDTVIGLSDHSLGIYTALGAVPLGARILEKHFTSDLSWPGPDVPISITPAMLHDLVEGSRAIFSALGGTKEIQLEEQPTIDFAYACVVAIKDIQPGETLTIENIWVKRPGTGEIKAVDFEALLGRKAKNKIQKDQQLTWADISK